MEIGPPALMDKIFGENKEKTETRKKLLGVAYDLALQEQQYKEGECGMYIISGRVLSAMVCRSPLCRRYRRLLLPRPRRQAQGRQEGSLGHLRV